VSKRKPSFSIEPVLPPGEACFSKTVTWNPWRANRAAAANPPIPAPITMIEAIQLSFFSDRNVIVILLRRSIEVLKLERGGFARLLSRVHYTGF
jgi:hypothetical protein